MKSNALTEYICIPVITLCELQFWLKFKINWLAYLKRMGEDLLIKMEIFFLTLQTSIAWDKTQIKILFY